MMRSMAASMESSGSISGKMRSFESGDRLVGKPDLVDFAAVKQLHDDLEQPLVSDQIVGKRARAAQIIGSDGVGVAHHPHIHHPHTALDQHGHSFRFQWISPERGTGSNLGAFLLINTKMECLRPE